MLLVVRQFYNSEHEMADAWMASYVEIPPRLGCF